MCIAVLCAAAVINICLAVFCSDETYTAYIVANILTDIIAFWAVYSFADFYLLPQYRKYCLYKKAAQSGERLTGRFTEFTVGSKYDKFDCVTAVFDCGGEKRKIFIIENTFESFLNSDGEVSLLLSDNIAVELGGGE